MEASTTSSREQTLPATAADVPEPSSLDGAAELIRLRNQVVAQARELVQLRWEISLLRRPGASNQFVSANDRLNKLRHVFARLFLEVAKAASRVHRALSNLLTLVRRSNASDKHSYLRVWRPPLLLVGDSWVATQITNRTCDTVSVSAGAGPIRSLPVPPIDEPRLQRPTDDSLVAWLVADPGRLRRIGTIVVDAEDELSLGLLRGRLTDQQTLMLTTGVTSPQPIRSITAELGPPSIDDPGFHAYTHFPARWLDPLDENRLPASAVVDQLVWPKISVVMVSFNQVSFLEEGLRSVLQQNYPNLEFIVVDGNSTDGSAEIVKRYQDRLSHLIIEPDRGQSDGLNKGFALATGDILTWVNSDDLLEPGALFRVAQAFSCYGVDIVAGGCRQIGLKRDVIINNHHNRLPFGIPVALPLGLLLEMDRCWLAGSFFYQPEVFFTRDIWERSGGKLRTDLNYILDYDLWVRMAAAGANVVHIPDYLAYSRTHDQQKTTVGMPQMPEVQRLMREYSNRLVSLPMDARQ
jgi:Glycosyl transferase family 2